VNQIVNQVNFQVPMDILLRLALAALILVIAYIISKVLAGIVAKALARANSKLTRQAKSIVVWSTWIIGTLLALNQLGLELAWLLVAVGIGAIIVVLIARDFLSNVAARETIYLYNQFKIGDWVQVGRVFGRVVDISWNDTVLSTLNNETVYIPNALMVRSVITNRTTQTGIRIAIPIIIDVSKNLQDVEQLLEIGTELREELVPESSPEVRVVAIDKKTVKIELLLRISNPAKSRLVSSEVLKRAKKRLDAA
jgi:small conductance mechanosensitive channel